MLSITCCTLTILTTLGMTLSTSFVDNTSMLFNYIRIIYLSSVQIVEYLFMISGLLIMSNYPIELFKIVFLGKKDPSTKSTQRTLQRNSVVSVQT